VAIGGNIEVDFPTGFSVTSGEAVNATLSNGGTLAVGNSSF